MKTGESVLRLYIRPELVKRDQLARVSGDDGVLISIIANP
jgi:hypothetical protein